MQYVSMTDGDISETDLRADSQCQKSNMPIRMRRGNDIPDKVHPMDALTAAVLVVFVVENKLVLFHPRLLHRHCGEALHLLLEHEAGLVFLIFDQFAVADDLAQLGDLRAPP